MIEGKLYDIFITHAWRYHDDWTRLGGLLDALPGLTWRNFSVPWHDPAMDPNSQVGGKFIRDWLETQIIPVHGVILLAGVYAVKSARKWLDLEIEIARRYGKPIVAVPAVGENLVLPEATALCDRAVAWDAASIITAIDELAGA